jgi:hypothetical protein
MPRGARTVGPGKKTARTLQDNAGSIPEKIARYARGTAGRGGIRAGHGCAYVMVTDPGGGLDGGVSSEDYFQEHAEHCAPRLDAPLVRIVGGGGRCGPRIALTFRRLAGDPGEAPDVTPAADGDGGGTLAARTREWQHPTRRCGVDVLVDSPLDLSYADALAALEPMLVDDKTRMGAKVFDNDGRRAVTLRLGERGPSRYRYGGKTMVTALAPQAVLGAAQAISTATGCPFDFVHVVVYPSGACGLAWHADDEAAIMRGSDIAGLSLYEDEEADARYIEFRPKKESAL